ncbi:MAG: hypothetical protein NTX59_02040 [Elusimicrobia bacterium]|nr:hypothetical protein [Elusimicrobiota bacterium]
MEKTWRFKDEWLLKAVATIPVVSPALVLKLRSEQRPLLSQALIDDKAVFPEQLAQAVLAVYRVKSVKITPEKVDKFGLTILSERLCRKYLVLPVAASDDEIQIATADPLNLDALSDIQALTARAAVPLYALPRDIESCMEELFN